MPAALLLLALVSLAAPATAAEDSLQPLRFLVGHCWAGEFPNGGGKDTHCFEAMFGSRFVRDRHVLHGKGPDYLGESIFAFDPTQREIVFWYWSSDGDMENGTVMPVVDGLNFPEHRLKQPSERVFRTHWKWIGADRYEALNERKNADGSWQTEWKIEYARVPDSK